MTDPRNADARRQPGEGGQAGTTGSSKHTTTEPPEHRGDRRRFLIWSLMLGAIPPQRVVERVVDEIEREGGR